MIILKSINEKLTKKEQKTIEKLLEDNNEIKLLDKIRGNKIKICKEMMK